YLIAEAAAQFRDKRLPVGLHLGVDSDGSGDLLRTGRVPSGVHLVVVGQLARQVNERNAHAPVVAHRRTIATLRTGTRAITAAGPCPATSPKRLTASTGIQVRTVRKITQRRWACGSGPGLGAVTGPGQEGYGLSGLGDGDGEAERLDLLDVVADFAVGVGAGLVAAGAEVGEPGGGVGEQVPDYGHDGAGDGDLGFGLAAAAGDP